MAHIISAIILSVAIIACTTGCINNGPIGMISGGIEDWQISASSYYPSEWDSGCHIKYARPYAQNGLGWCARFKTKSEWLQIDLGVISTVTGVMTQGRADGQEWVSEYLVSYSPDGEKWSYVTDQSNAARVFEGNSDAYNIHHNYLPFPIQARFVKIQVYSWNRHPSMRVELIGCQDNKQPLGLPPYGNLKASSAHRYRGGISCQVEDGHMLSNKAWCPSDASKNEWIQLDIGSPSLVTALITKGRGDTGRKQWVSRYRVSYSNDSLVWQFYEDKFNLEEYLGTHEMSNDTNPFASLPNKIAADGVMEFGGNFDKEKARINYLAHPFIARYIRFHPVEWHRDIAMRVGVLGRPHDGDCLPGYTRPNPISPCVENIAFKKETWLNKERHKKRALEGVYDPSLSDKLAQKAVDGITINDINSCAIIDSYYDDEPQLTIDLGGRYDVSGVVVYTWQGQQDTSNTYNKDYAVSLESLSIYISSGKSEVLCGKISNSNNELILKREHSLTCNRRINGKYIRIQPDGRAERWQKWYSAVLCEVMAFT